MVCATNIVSDAQQAYFATTSEVSKMMTYTNTKPSISCTDYFDFLKYLDKNLVAGVELERGTGNNQRDLLVSAFKIQSNVQTTETLSSGAVNEYNLACIKEDGSLLHRGFEFIFAGTGEGFDWVHKRLRDFENRLDRFQDIPDYYQPASNHITFLCLQKRLIPLVVWHNLWNMARYFQPAIFYLGAGDKQSFIRPGIARFAKPRFIPFFDSITDRANFEASTGKFSLMNVSKNAWNQAKGGSLGIVVEFRSVDGFRVPSALATMMFVFKAMIYKSFEMSLKGVAQWSVVDIASSDNLTQTMLNGRVKSASFTAQYGTLLKTNVREFVDFLKPTLKRIASPCLPVLEQMAIKPIASRDGKWSEIEQELSKAIPSNHNISKSEKALLDLVFSETITADSATEWKSKAGQALNIKSRMIEYLVKKIESKTGYRLAFSQSLKMFVLGGGD